MSDSYWPHGLPHARLLCPLLSSRVWIWIFSNSCPLSRWCCLTISSSVIPFSFCIQYWSFSFSISPSNEYSGLISFSMDWLDLLAVQGTLKSLLQHHSLKASILEHPAFFLIQISHPYMTIRKTIALSVQIFILLPVVMYKCET